MPNSAQRPAITVRPAGRDIPADDAWRSSSELAAGLQSVSKIVPFFVEPGISPPRLADVGPGETDWPAALDLIRDVGDRVRRARDFAQEVSRQSQSIIRRSLKQTEEAERRAEAAEASAAAAIARAERAEELARLSEARAKLAEKQAEAAKAGEAEAQLWLRRVHACLKDEFKDLTEDPT